MKREEFIIGVDRGTDGEISLIKYMPTGIYIGYDQKLSQAYWYDFINVIDPFSFYNLKVYNALSAGEFKRFRFAFHQFRGFLHNHVVENFHILVDVDDMIVYDSRISVHHYADARMVSLFVDEEEKLNMTDITQQSIEDFSYENHLAAFQKGIQDAKKAFDSILH